jgi:hypothetical protein
MRRSYLVCDEIEPSAAGILFRSGQKCAAYSSMAALHFGCAQRNTSFKCVTDVACSVGNFDSVFVNCRQVFMGRPTSIAPRQKPATILLVPCPATIRRTISMSQIPLWQFDDPKKTLMSH